jgi:1,4-alpha-glucan branching enzyme
MKNISTLLVAALFPVLAVAQAEVTFNVDMSCAPDFETVFVTGPWCGWCAETGDNVMTDDDGDGIYTVTLGGFTGTVEYKYALNGFALQENLVNDMADLGADCAPITDYSAYANRTIEAGSVTNDFYGTCDGTCNDDVTQADSYMITFQVDMSEYTGAYTTVNLNGSFNGWCGGCAAMTDADGDMIYELAVDLPAADTVEYKFTVDGWTDEEVLGEGPCTSTIDGFTNRSLVITSEETLPAVCWNSCDVCGSGTGGNVPVVFQVDMSEYTGTYGTVNLNGSFNGWCGSCAEMTDADGDMVYELTVDLPLDVLEYKFTLDGWNAQEEFTEGESCTSTIDGYTNRTITVTGPTTLDPVCYNSCEACGGVVTETADVTFYVDMNEQTVAGPVYLTGNTIDNWCGTCVEMTDADGDGVYEVTVSLESGDHEFKFNNGGWDGTENLDEVEDAACTITASGFTNRIVTTSGTDAIMLDAVCFESCAACTINVDELNGVSFDAFVTTAGAIQLELPALNNASEVELTDLTGAVVARWNVAAGSTREVLEVPASANGIYLISVTHAGQRSVAKVMLTH